MTSERSDRAVAHFNAGFSCSQAICLAYGDEFGLSPSDAARVAAGFGGGMARTDRICGAVTGGVMVLGLAYGGTGAEDRIEKEATYAAVQEFLAAFETAHGSISCTELLGYNLGKPAEAAAAREAGAVPRVCPGLVRSTGLLLEEILARRTENPL
jgi:C_GCAxxG_C_C family probable redox protein